MFVTGFVKQPDFLQQNRFLEWLCFINKRSYFGDFMPIFSMKVRNENKQKRVEINEN